MIKERKHRGLLYTVIIFGIIYSLISLVNHYNFRTYALDLGLYNNALYSYSHFHWNYSSVMQAFAENLLADHFDVYLVLFSPLSWIFGSYTLLIVQIVAVLLGGVGVYKFFNEYDKETKLPLLAAIHFYLFFGIYSALAFDYHSNVVAAMIVPWFFYFFSLRKYAAAFVLLIFICLAKENMSLWMLFICLGLMTQYRRDKKALLFLLSFCFFSIIYFITVVNFLMPLLSLGNAYHHFDYSFLGNNFSDALKTICTNPLEVMKGLFVNHSGNAEGNYFKTELYVFVLLSGGFLLLLKPSFIIMLIPIFFQKMFHDNAVMWSISGQYSIEFAPIVNIGVFAFLQEIKNQKHVKLLAWIILILTLAVTIRRMDRTVIFTDSSRIRFYKKSHFEKDYDVVKVHEAMNNLPANVAVSAQSPFVPHLAMRNKIYQFPIVQDADYIVFSRKEVKYPLNEEQFTDTLISLYSSDQWETVYDIDDFLMFKRKR